MLHQEDFIFINNITGESYSIPYLNVVMKKISSRCNVDIHPHKLRHYFASQADISGISKRVTADLLGHKNISTTDLYIHSDDESNKDSAFLMNRILSNQ
ncbi:tyrosine-type recombinase/integrase [Carnobacterium gallinarum]|uniref:tyrosine-type recombinase/integrase n=1 Tax=Carnobacterium gallinarum TaxID=2749 RepID=UPI003CCBBEE7